MRCFTCGYVLGNKWREYEKRVAEKHHGVRSSSGTGAGDATKSRDIMTPIYLDLNVKIRTIHGEVLDDLKITRICCRKNMLTHVDLIQKI